MPAASACLGWNVTGSRCPVDGAAPVVTAPSPPAGEGCSAVEQNGLGEGEFATPHPAESVDSQAPPSPAWGEGAITSARISGGLKAQTRTAWSGCAARAAPA